MASRKPGKKPVSVGTASPKKKASNVKAGGKKLSSLQELERETEKILHLKTEISRNFWELGSSLVRVEDNELFRAAGYRTLEEYLRREVKVGRSTAYKVMKLARNFSKDTAQVFGQEKLLGAIAYAKATPEDERPIDVTRYEIEVRGPSGKMEKKPFEEASVKEIDRATDRLRRKQRSVLSPAPAGRLLDTAEGRLSLLLSRADQFFGTMNPRPRLELSIAKKGSDPVVSLKLSNLPWSRLTEVLVYLAGAAV